MITRTAPLLLRLGASATWTRAAAGWALALSLTACSTQPAATPRAIDTSAPLQPVWLTGPAPDELSGMAVLRDRAAPLMLASETEGLLQLDAQGQRVWQLAGNFEGLDARWLGGDRGHAVVSVDQQARAVRAFADGAGEWREVLRLTTPAQAIEGLCLYLDPQRNLHLFTLHDDAPAQQWLLASASGWLPQARLERALIVPWGAETCAVDDASAELYVAEPDVGLWRQSASPEGTSARRPLLLQRPIGALDDAQSPLALRAGELLLADAGLLWRRLADGEPERHPVAALASLELTAIGLDDNRLWFYDEASMRFGALDWPAVPSPPQPPVVAVAAETTPVAEAGDAADDPAIWINRRQPQASRILGTNKQAGLEVYDLGGKRLQQLAVGAVNNVDLRQALQLRDGTLDLAAASHRPTNAVALFAIDPVNGELTALGLWPTELNDIYGLCMYRSPAGQGYVIVNDKDGRFVQYRVDGSVRAPELVAQRRFAVDGQPEGCVADDLRGRLFVGEEDRGVWTLSAQAQDPAAPQLIHAVGKELQADVEGLALYQGPRHAYLLVSSQGNDSYVVYDAEAPYALRGVFRAGLNAQAGVDGASETDGLELTSAALGPDYPLGLLVVQDGRNRLPPQPQNFKLLSWASVLQALGLPE